MVNLAGQTEQSWNLSEGFAVHALHIHFTTPAACIGINERAPSTVEAILDGEFLADFLRATGSVVWASPEDAIDWHPAPTLRAA